MKPGVIFAIMVGIVDGSFGAGTVDDIIKGVLAGKSNDEIMFDAIKKRGKKSKEQYGTIMNPKNCGVCGIILDSITCAVEGNLERRICDECKRREDVA